MLCEDHLPLELDHDMQEPWCGQRVPSHPCAAPGRPREPGAALAPGAPAPPRARLGCVRVTFLAQNSTLLDSGNLKFRDGKQIDNRLLYSIRNQPKSSLFTKMKGGGPSRPRTENQDKTMINTLQSGRPVISRSARACSSAPTSSRILKRGDARPPSRPRSSGAGAALEWVR